MRYAPYMTPVLTTVVALAVYWPRLGDYFVYDDFVWLQAVRNHSFAVVMYRAFTFPAAAPDDQVTLFWRPLTDFYFYLARGFGLHAQPYHVVNVVLHGVGAGTAITFLWRLGRSALPAAAAGLLFTVSPSYGFAVTWISQASELIGAAFVVLALTSYRSYLVAEKPGQVRLACVFMCGALAFLAKESTVILVGLLPALAVAVPASERRRSTAEIVRSLAVVMVLGLVVATVMLAQERRTEQGTYGLGAHVLRNLRAYLEWMVFPYRARMYAEWRTLGALLFMAAGILSIGLRQRPLAFLFIWTIVALLPFCAFPFGMQPRYTYLATLPFTAFVVFGVVAMLRALPGMIRLPAMMLAGALTVAALAVMPLRVRDSQDFLASEARAYETMVTSVRSLCGDLPPDSSVWVLDRPYQDLYGANTPAAVNLNYGKVHVVSDKGAELPSLIGLVPNLCIIQYDPRTAGYRRVPV